MKKQKRTDRWTITLLTAFSVFIAAAILFLAACGGGEKESLQQQNAQYQEKVKSLENQLQEKDSVIRTLEKNVKNLSGQLPESHAVVSGDSHWKIAHDYLIGRAAVPEEQAGQILMDTALFGEILVGQRAWNCYADGVFGSFITQGDAAISPGRLQRAEKRSREEEKLKLSDQISKLETLKSELEKKSAAELEKCMAEKTTLQDRMKSLDGELSNMKNQSQELEARLNSVYYFAGAKDNLKATGKIKGSFLGLCGDRIKNVTFSDFQGRLDLRNSDTIELSAANHGLSVIRDIDLFPRFMEEGKDYRLEIAPDRKSAKVRLLDKENFRLARVILVLD